MVALYIHIPFCRRKCGYCSFVSFAGREAEVPPYINALKQELAWRGRGQKLHTIYFGGGTPSLLSAAQLEDILTTTRAQFETPDGIETTLEANPGTIDGSYLAAIRQPGINRLSLGIQSLDDGQLALLGRLHTSSEAREAVQMARAAGFDNLNLDLIYAIPGAPLAQWQKTLGEAVELSPKHLSLYSLTLEEDTPLFAAVQRGEIPSPDPDAAAAEYEFAEDLLELAGYRHYEISNWAKPGFESQHNLVYWKNQSYLGIGVAAHSYHNGRRQANTPDVGRYIEKLSRGELPLEQDEEISPELEVAETVILGLRLTEGISYREIWRTFGIDSLTRYRHQIRELLDMGLLESDGSYLRLTRRGRLLGNEVFWRFLP